MLLLLVVVVIIVFVVYVVAVAVAAVGAVRPSDVGASAEEPRRNSGKCVTQEK